MGLEEGAQASGSERMEVAPIEGCVETIGKDGGGEKDKCYAVTGDLNLQEDRTGESPQMLTALDNVGLGVLQLSRLEGKGGVGCLSPMEEMFVKLTGEIKRGFSVSEANQASIKEMCEALESKFDLLEKKTQLWENSMETLREEVVLIKQDLRKSKDSEQDLRDKLERFENMARRNNLRILNIPEGQEGDNIKMFCASLIKKSLQLEESEREIAANIQRAHMDPFRRDTARKKPQKI
ncbi:hypothetical protein NDU88_006449 [Pleurodeles waltl]|uniref:Uncharacterized protein n=1 Tax=Pleurodeles waltl TaxID=8319 RepID=A0AAV7NTA9_PLEWA|nr:hypothetical protein NDU88_006449 [Pleurodeles waltl]